MRKFLTLALVAAQAVMPSEVSAVLMTQDGSKQSKLFTPVTYRYATRLFEKGNTDVEKQRDDDIKQLLEQTKKLQKRLEIAEAKIDATDKRVDNNESRISLRDRLT